MAIPFVLVGLARRRRDLPYPGLMLLFAAFIFGCGTGHLMDVVVTYYPCYRFYGLVKFFTAVVSWGTVFALIPVVPKVLLMKSPAQLEQEVDSRTVELQRINARLEEEVTERKRVEGQLRDKISEFQLVMEMLPVAVFRSDDAACSHISGNDEGRKMLGTGDSPNISLSDPEGRNSSRYKCLYPNGQEVPLDQLPMQKAGVENADIENVEHVLLFPDGRRVIICQTAKPIRDLEGKVRGVYAVVKDITQQKALEAQLLAQLARMENIIKRKDEFLAMLGHELRNPMQAVRNAIDLLRMAPDNIKTRTAALDLLTNQSEHITRLVDDIIAVTRALKGRIELKREVVSLSHIVERSVEIAEPLISKGRHKLEVSLPPEPVMFVADKIRLVQVVSNLLTNAAKYTHDGGLIQIRCETTQKEVVITVRDNGIGIDAKDLPEIFDLCVRTERAVHKENGLGVGLTMVKTIVELHQGSVTATSEGHDKGAEFVIRLPFMEELSHESPAR